MDKLSLLRLMYVFYSVLRSILSFRKWKMRACQQRNGSPKTEMNIKIGWNTAKNMRPTESDNNWTSAPLFPSRTVTNNEIKPPYLVGDKCWILVGVSIRVNDSGDEMVTYYVKRLKWLRLWIQFKKSTV